LEGGVWYELTASYTLQPYRQVCGILVIRTRHLCAPVRRKEQEQQQQQQTQELFVEHMGYVATETQNTEDPALTVALLEPVGDGNGGVDNDTDGSFGVGLEHDGAALRTAAALDSRSRRRELKDAFKSGVDGSAV
jgi:hypothetical protein